MVSSPVAEATGFAIAEIRRILEPRGVVDGPFHAFKAGHMPDKGPAWYSANVYNGLDDAEIDELEAELDFPIPEQTEAHIPAPLRAFLRVTNGLECHALSIYGDAAKIEHAVAAPISLRYGQYPTERAPDIPRTWFGFGSINGPWASQGLLYLTEVEEVVLAHRDTGQIGARWHDLSDFLVSEIPRQLAVHDPDGDLRAGCAVLPGETSDWEEIARRADADRRAEATVTTRMKRWWKQMLSGDTPPRG